MHSNLEYGKHLVNSQGQYMVSSAGKESLLEVVEPGDENQSISSTDERESLEKRTYVQGPQVQKQRLRRKPSPTVWRFALIIGDSLVLIALLVLIINPAPHLGLYVPGSVFGTWNTTLVWLFLVLASWGIAVTIMQAQQLNCAASILKSPLYALCSLVLMIIFCIVLLCLFIGNGVIAFIRPLFFFLTVAAPIFSLWRALLAEAMNLPSFRRQAVIVGVNAAGRSVARELLSARHPPVNVLGYIGEGTDEQKQQDGLPVFGGRSALHTLAQNGIIDMVIMALDYKANPESLSGSSRGRAARNFSDSCGGGLREH